MKPEVYGLEIKRYEFTALIESQNLPIEVLKELGITTLCAVEVCGYFSVKFEDSHTSYVIIETIDAWNDKNCVNILDVVDIYKLSSEIEQTDDGSWEVDRQGALADAAHDFYSDR